MTAQARCSTCGYSKEDAQINMDHHLCKNAGYAPWERPTARGGDYRPHYRKSEADTYIDTIHENYRKCLDREKVWLTIIDELMIAIATDSRKKISQAYNRAAMKLSIAARARKAGA